VHDHQTSRFIKAEFLELRMQLPQNKYASSRFHLPFLYLYPTYHPTGGVQALQKTFGHLSVDVKAILRSAEPNPGALNTIDLGPTARLVRYIK
jgi:hypothetical protein